MEVNKSLENRHQALKWMYSQPNGFTYKEVIDKFHVPTTFLSGLTKKALIKTSGVNGSIYIGGEPDIKLAVETYDYERQRIGKICPNYKKKTVPIEGLDKFKGIVEKAINSQVPMKEDSPIVQQRKIPYSFSVNIQDGMVTMKWSDFSKLMNK